MKLSTITFYVFPVVVVVLSLIVGFSWRELENRFKVVRVYEESSEKSDKPKFTLGSTNTLYNPYEAADTFINEASNIFATESSDWYMELNTKDLSVETRFLGDGPPAHRVRLHIQSKYNSSQIFNLLTAEKHVKSLFPVSTSVYASFHVTCITEQHYPFRLYLQAP